MTQKDLIMYEKMSKFELLEEERTEILKAAQMLTDSFKVLENIDVSAVEPLIDVIGIKNIMREDIAEKIYDRELVLSNAPEQYDGYFQVPKTVE